MGCGESAGNFRENGSLSPAADRGTGSTGLSGRTHRFHLLGKCRAFLRKRFTFPRGRQGCRLTGLSGRTHRFHLRGKCREFLRFWFTFPRGSHGHRLHRPLWRHSPFPPPGKVPGFPAKTVHFPPCGVLMKIQQSKRPGPPTASRRAPPSRAEGG